MSVVFTVKWSWQQHLSHRIVAKIKWDMSHVHLSAWHILPSQYVLAVKTIFHFPFLGLSPSVSLSVSFPNYFSGFSHFLVSLALSFSFLCFSISLHVSPFLSGFFSLLPHSHSCLRWRNTAICLIFPRFWRPHLWQAQHQVQHRAGSGSFGNTGSYSSHWVRLRLWAQGSKWDPLILVFKPQQGWSGLLWGWRFLDVSRVPEGPARAARKGGKGSRGCALLSLCVSSDQIKRPGLSGTSLPHCPIGTGVSQANWLYHWELTGDKKCVNSKNEITNNSKEMVKERLVGLFSEKVLMESYPLPGQEKALPRLSVTVPWMWVCRIPLCSEMPVMGRGGEGDMISCQEKLLKVGAGDGGSERGVCLRNHVHFMTGFISWV